MVALSHIRDLPGHCSISVTEWYDRQTLGFLKAGVSTLDDEQAFKSPSREEQSTIVATSRTLCHFRGCAGVANCQTHGITIRDRGGQ